MLLMTAAWAAEPPEDTDEQPARGGESKVLALTPSQEQAVGIRIERPLALSGAPQIEAYGTVLDPVALVGDLGKVESTRAAASAAAADAARQERLYHDNAQASLKALQTSQAQAVEASAQARAAALGFRLQWGPLSDWSAAQQRTLLEAATQGQLLLLRADVPGQPLGSAIDPHALVRVGGVGMAARVLGPLPRTDAPSQSAGWLLQIEHAPAGLGPGARAAVQLRTAAVAGLLVPADALLYGEEGAYVYRRVSAGGGDTFRFAPVSVRPVARVGSAWLVAGLERGDQVVVRGAGVLWSLQGLGTFSAAEEEHD